MGLTVAQIENNCQCFYNYSFTNLTAQDDATVAGFSNWYGHHKIFKMVTDWQDNYEGYTAVQKVVDRTLDGMESLLEFNDSSCPRFLYLDQLVKPGKAVPVTYAAIARRILASNTLKECTKIRKKAENFIQLFNNHKFGIRIDSLDQKALDLKEPYQLYFKHCLIYDVLQDLAQQLAGEKASLSYSKSAPMEKLRSPGEKIHPPTDTSDQAALNKYLQEMKNQVQSKCNGLNLLKEEGDIAVVKQMLEDTIPQYEERFIQLEKDLIQ